MGNTNATSASVEQEVKNVLESNEEVSNEMLASLMWDSPPEALLAALKEEDFGLSEFVWLDKKDKSESDNSHERNQKSSEGDEARARRIAEIRRRVEEEVARRRKEMAQQEEEAEKRAKRKNLADNALVLQCAHCSAPITKGVNVIAATAANGKVYCKAHSTQLLKARAYEQKAAKQQKPRHGKRAH
ncbi:uncharacterized protein ACA1_369760 [Acanthamoeba castellanii str. Neff]|uniref:Uncharacterized protein n=1 Tax=Acanthamoeba castellanii (strain ATCC 30010 / Neff) TaxID=1257118 RepID=L8H0E2_ACACF|nr:uncharacterized protein ACA1_369760 [Acanthamoeba castellanii str. Neff]ELR18233.1 hypothetical protein ACA1_369760 [Acanthamoeba castellanii str. Neff]